MNKIELVKLYLPSKLIEECQYETNKTYNLYGSFSATSSNSECVDVFVYKYSLSYLKQPESYQLAIHLVF
jgi:hypothetical protein